MEQQSEIHAEAGEHRRPPQEQPERQDLDRHTEEVENKASALHKSLVGLGIPGPGIRVDEVTGEASLIDLVRMLCPDKNPECVKKTLARVIANDCEHGATQQDQTWDTPSPFQKSCATSRSGQATPVGDAKNNDRGLWLLPAGATRKFRRQSAETITRVLGGDVTLCEEIEQRCARLQSTEEGRA